jgi:hypothetical protein
MKITVRTSARIHIFPADWFLTSADAVKVASARTLECIRADKVRLHGHGASEQTHPSVRADAFVPSLASPLPSLPPLRTQFAVRADTRKKKKKEKTPQASRAKPREEGFFGLVPLVTHPSSIPLLGGLTPKFLSLSLHSL